ncbi:hypothetical protein [Flavihumibacter petaseus]|uniref:Uncharacterized protein n=1 Tax=Flavihumibacter petaseus NBRC 106054 TaxID=1220578 RepID=A0A0E9N118_9BACT|nr:hypothetical protein [Flavihumibacter petaseus]GAO43544.1 hypothetical protein FPE01S_02_06490 [Flavihumibacter petaseus NBRC 106054]
MHEEFHYNERVRKLKRKDGFEAFVFSNLNNPDDLKNVPVDAIVAVSIKESFNYDLIALLTRLQVLTMFDIVLDEYAIQQMMCLTGLKRLNLVDCKIKSPFDLGRFADLEEIDLNWSNNVDFSGCANLRELVIRKVGSFDLRFLQMNAKLEKVEILGGTITSLNGLESLKALKGLLLMNLRRLEQLTELTALPSAEYLFLMGLKLKVDISPLQRLSNLKWLVLENCPEVSSLGLLLHMPSMKGVLVIKKGQKSEEEKAVTSALSDITYRYFRKDSVINRLVDVFSKGE